MGQDGEPTPRDQGALYLDVLRVGFSVSFKNSVYWVNFLPWFHLEFGTTACQQNTDRLNDLWGVRFTKPIHLWRCETLGARPMAAKFRGSRET